MHFFQMERTLNEDRERNFHEWILLQMKFFCSWILVEVTKHLEYLNFSLYFAFTHVTRRLLSAVMRFIIIQFIRSSYLCLSG